MWYVGWVLDASSRPTFRELGDEFEKMATDPTRYLVIEVETSETTLLFLSLFSLYCFNTLERFD